MKVRGLWSWVSKSLSLQLKANPSLIPSEVPKWNDWFNRKEPGFHRVYVLVKIKCSICSYQSNIRGIVCLRIVYSMMFLEQGAWLEAFSPHPCVTQQCDASRKMHPIQNLKKKDVGFQELQANATVTRLATDRATFTLEAQDVRILSITSLFGGAVGTGLPSHHSHQKSVFLGTVIKDPGPALSPPKHSTISMCKKWGLRVLLEEQKWKGKDRREVRRLWSRG